MNEYNPSIDELEATFNEFPEHIQVEVNKIYPYHVMYSRDSEGYRMTTYQRIACAMGIQQYAAKTLRKGFNDMVKEVREIDSPYSNLNSMTDYQKARNKALKIIHKFGKILNIE